MLKNSSTLKVSANRMQNMKAHFRYYAEVQPDFATAKEHSRLCDERHRRKRPKINSEKAE